MQILRQLGRAVAAAVPGLIRFLQQSENESIQIAAIRALSGIGPSAQLAVPSLLSKLNDPRPAIRMCVVEALRSIEVGGPEICQGLVNKLHDPKRRIRAAAAKALGSLPIEATPEVVSGLCEQLFDSSRRVRAYAVVALGHLKPQDSRVIPMMRELLSSGQMHGLEKIVHDAIGQLSTVNRL
jgi:HEAT repeat protein